MESIKTALSDIVTRAARMTLRNHMLSIEAVSYESVYVKCPE